MDPTTEAATSGSEQTAVVIPAAPAPEGERAIGAREAARSLANWRHKRSEQTTTDTPADKAAPATAAPAAEPESEAAPAADDAAPQAEAPGETQEAEPPEQQPPLEPPRSWTKDEKERFKSLPRETQEYLANREQERDREIRRSQNEAAEKLKG